MPEYKLDHIPAISIIAPMYNVEKYVGQCLESILRQTFKDYELLIVDDCSTDNSKNIVEEYEPRFDGKLKYIKMKKNTGAAALPRNTGIRLSRGKYIAFIDPDDLFINNALEDLFNAAESTQADVVHTEKFYISKDEVIGKGSKLKMTSYERGSLVDKITLEEEDLEKRIRTYANWRYFWFPWGKLFNRDFVVKNDITFPNWPTADDTIFCFKCLCLAKNYVRIPSITNIYRIRDDSLTNKNLQLDKYIHRWLNITIEGTRIIDNFMNEIDFFKEHSELKYIAMDFFIREKLNWFYRVYKGNVPYKVDPFLRKEFSVDPENNIALMSYLFNTVNIYNIHFGNQRRKILQLQQQIKELQKKIQ